MSLVFEALQSLEAERYGVFRPSPPEEVEMLRCVERRVSLDRGTLPKGPDVEVHASEPAKLFSVPSPVAASAAVASPVDLAPVAYAAAIAAPVVAAAVSPVAAGAVAVSAVGAVSIPERAAAVELSIQESAVAERVVSESAAPERVVQAKVAMAAPRAKVATAAPLAVSPWLASTKAARIVAMLSAALPVVQNALNLLDGKKDAAVSKAPPEKPQESAVASAQAQVDLAAIANGLTAIKNQSRELRAQVVEQNGTLRGIEDQLEQVREATHRNTMEQKELIEDLKGVGSRINLVAVAGLSLLGASVAIDLILYLRMLKVL